MRCKRSLACLVATGTCAATTAFVIPATTTSLVPSRGLLPLHSRSTTISRSREQVHCPLGHKAAVGGSILSAIRSCRPRARATRTSMVFGGGGGGGTGGRGPKGPLGGLEPGTLATIAFTLLVIFAPGVIFGAFNTLFLVRGIVTYMLHFVSLS